MGDLLAPIAVSVVSFAVMEPVTALVHRAVMHGPGWILHRSHHRNAAAGVTHRFEANDAFPLVFAAIVMIGLAVGFNVAGFDVLVPVGIGVTVYGAAYALVHDLYIHRRLDPFQGRRLGGLEGLAEAHALHHRGGGAPYGMLVPMRPRSGSRPSHEPDAA